MEFSSLLAEHPLAATGVGVVLGLGLLVPLVKRTGSKDPSITLATSTDADAAARTLELHRTLIETLAKPGTSITKVSTARLSKDLTAFGNAGRKARSAPVADYVDEAQGLIADMVQSHLNNRNARRRWPSVTNAFVRLYQASGAPDTEQIVNWARAQSVAETGTEAPSASLAPTAQKRQKPSKMMRKLR